MADRINIPFTGEHFAAWCLKMVGQPYWYGCVVYKCTESLRERKSKQYPEHYAASRTARYRQDIAAKKVCSDCVGGCKGYAWSNAGQGVVESIGSDRSFTNQYGTHGCPDKSANGMFDYAKSKGMEWGVIGTLPEIPGLALRMDGHVGYYIGGGYAVEWRGFNYGCVKTKVAGRGWTHWYKLPFIDYGNTAASKPAAPIVPSLGDRLLKKGSKGEDVKALQLQLLKLGYDLVSYGADGDFGSVTESAVRAFQKKAGLEVDGLYGSKSHAALMSAIADLERMDVPEEKPEKKTVKTTSATKVRCGNSSKYALITTVETGTELEYVATAENGWTAVVVNAQVGWIKL